MMIFEYPNKKTIFSHKHPAVFSFQSIVLHARRKEQVLGPVSPTRVAVLQFHHVFHKEYSQQVADHFLEHPQEQDRRGRIEDRPRQQVSFFLGGGGGRDKTADFET